jgi:hypothetical protein
MVIVSTIASGKSRSQGEAMPMDFVLTEEQEMLQNPAREFAKKEITKEEAVEWERQNEESYGRTICVL